LGPDGRMCPAGTSLMARSAAPAPQRFRFRRAAATGDPSDHPLTTRATGCERIWCQCGDHRMRNLLNRAGCCRGGRQTTRPGGSCRLTGQVTRLLRAVCAGLAHLRRRPWADRTRRRSCPAQARRARRWAGRRGRTDISPSEACSRALALRAQSAGRLAGSPEWHASIVPVPRQRRQDDRARPKTQPVMTNQESTRPAGTTRQPSAGA
jgi:hypothetical protein